VEGAAFGEGEVGPGLAKRLELGGSGRELGGHGESWVGGGGWGIGIGERGTGNGGYLGDGAARSFAEVGWALRQ